MINITKVFKVLSGKGRLGVYLMILNKPGISQVEINKKSRKLVQPAVSVMLQYMVDAGMIVRHKKKPNLNYYTVGSEAVARGVRDFIDLVSQAEDG